MAVKLIVVSLVAPALALAQTRPSPTPHAPRVQVPRIAIIDFYGLRKTPEDRVRKALAVREGDPLPSSKEDAEERLADLPGVVDARLEAVCCVGNNASLFVGIEERGAAHFAARSSPAGSSLLPGEMLDAYDGFLHALQEAARGDYAEDLTQGHSRMRDAKSRAYQERFLEFAATNVNLLRDVLRNSTEEEHRAAAAFIIGYAPKKKDVVNDLQDAMQDPNPAVRSNAMRALTAISVLASRQPDLGIRIPVTWFVELLNSIVLSDRHQASIALGAMTETRAPSDLDFIRERALDAIVEMARWKTLEYALPPFLLAGRMAGLPDQEIFEAWKRGDREAVIGKILPGRRKK